MKLLFVLGDFYTIFQFTVLLVNVMLCRVKQTAWDHMSSYLCKSVHHYCCRLLPQSSEFTGANTCWDQSLQKAPTTSSRYKTSHCISHCKHLQKLFSSSTTCTKHLSHHTDEIVFNRLNWVCFDMFRPPVTHTTSEWDNLLWKNSTPMPGCLVGLLLSKMSAPGHTKTGQCVRQTAKIRHFFKYCQLGKSGRICLFSILHTCVFGFGQDGLLFSGWDV